MTLNDLFTLPTSRPDLEACTKFGTSGVFAGPRIAAPRRHRHERTEKQTTAQTCDSSSTCTGVGAASSPAVGCEPVATVASVTGDTCLSVSLMPAGDWYLCGDGDTKIEGLRFCALRVHVCGSWRGCRWLLGGHVEPVVH